MVTTKKYKKCTNLNQINVNDIMLEKWGVSYFGGHKDAIDWSLWDEYGKCVPV